MKRFNITTHCRERFRERVSDEKDTTRCILNQLLKTKDITEKIFDDCPRYMLHLYEKYNSANQRIFISSDDVIFIAKKVPHTGTQDPHTGTFDIVTCYKHNENFLRQFKDSAQTRKETYFKIILLKKKLKSA